MNHKGFGLVILIMLIAIFGLIFVGTSVVLTNGINEMQLRIDKVKAHYLAQAGVMDAVHNWLASDNSETNRRYAELDTTVLGNQKFKTGCQANFAYFSFDGADWTDGNTTLRKWKITNIHSSNSITAKSVKVNWEPVVEGITLNEVRLNDTVVASGNFTNDSVISLDLTTLASGDNWGGPLTSFTWSGNPTDTGSITVSAQWTFNDDSSTKDSVTHNVLYWDGGQGNEKGETGKGKHKGKGKRGDSGQPVTHTFCVTSTGQVAQASGAEGFPILKTVKATCSGSAGGGDNVEILDWQELDKNIP